MSEKVNPWFSSVLAFGLIPPATSGTASLGSGNGKSLLASSSSGPATGNEIESAVRYRSVDLQTTPDVTVHNSFKGFTVLPPKNTPNYSSNSTQSVQDNSTPEPVIETEKADFEADLQEILSMPKPPSTDSEMTDFAPSDSSLNPSAPSPSPSSSFLILPVSPAHSSSNHLLQNPKGILFCLFDPPPSPAKGESAPDPVTFTDPDPDPDPDHLPATTLSSETPFEGSLLPQEETMPLCL
ncbi:hypothetical protein DY000_02026096 [Brassica cretica]|uniref:Uncharacterized protein n=1 Tax=Brassica cretica TaxID=69181 RepID=A0ABQ7EF76_BRACR|nr:hypothetical protein DY000_02026096 [Brassica cretica]